MSQAGETQAPPPLSPAATESISRSSAIRMTLAWIGARTPATIVRFGEGEGRLIEADPARPETMEIARNKIRRQTGQIVGDADVLRIRAEIMRAFDRADVLGIHGSASFNEEHLLWVRRIEAAYADRQRDGRPPAYLTHCLLNDDVWEALPTLLHKVKRISVVSCRNVGPMLKDAYNLKRVRMYQIPSQWVKRSVDDDYEAQLHDEPMWPDAFERVSQALTVHDEGEIFLIGAGLFGKGWCIDVRDKGGIAIDIGSRLDFMVGKVTRGAGKASAASAVAQGDGRE